MTQAANLAAVGSVSSSTGVPFSTSVLNSGTPVASTSGTAVTFTSIPSWVKRITVALNNVQTSGSSYLRFQLGSGSITSSGYAGASIGVTNGQGSNGANYANGGGFDVYQYAPAVTSSSVYFGTAVFTLIGTNLWTTSINISQSGNGCIGLVSGNVGLSGTLDRVSLTTVSGSPTFTAGSVNILYE